MASSNVVRLLDEALVLVPKYGFSRLAIEEAAHRLQLSRVAHGLVAGGELDLVSHFIRRCNAQLPSLCQQQEAAEEEGEGHKKISSSSTPRSRLVVACRHRLGLVIPHAAYYSQALSILAHPLSVTKALCLLHETSDSILSCARDPSVDWMWYKKRALLSAAYSSAELHMLSDASEGKRDTLHFMDQQLDRLFVTPLQTWANVSKLF